MRQFGIFGITNDKIDNVLYITIICMNYFLRFARQLIKYDNL